MKLKIIKRLKNDKGMTLVELLLSSLLILIIVSLTSLSYFNSINSSETTINIATSVRDARTAMYRITKDIREISDIEEADKDKVTFYSNVNSDEEFEKIEYYLEEDEDEEGYFNLIRSVDDEGEKIIAGHLISDEVFSYKSYYGEESIETPLESFELGSVKNIIVNLIIDQESTTEGSRTMNLETSIALRNRI
jgi:prepilin-type N-terminal cleavage/methylation domain-containing protein